MGKARLDLAAELTRNYPGSSRWDSFSGKLKNLTSDPYRLSLSHWALAACNEPGLAEVLASVDVREFTSVEALRLRFLEIMPRKTLALSRFSRRKELKMRG